MKTYFHSWQSAWSIYLQAMLNKSYPGADLGLLNGLFIKQKLDYLILAKSL